MSLDEGLDDGEAKAQPSVFLGIRLEWLEHCEATLFRYSLAVVADPALDAPSAGPRAPIMTSPRGV